MICIFIGKISGFFGYWDDNSDKEYFLLNNEVFSIVLIMFELYYKFG